MCWNTMINPPASSFSIAPALVAKRPNGILQISSSFGQHTAGFEEWKPVTALDTAYGDDAGAVPTRTIRRLALSSWRKRSTGAWLVLSGTDQTEVHPLVIQNLKFLQDFWIHPYNVRHLSKKLKSSHCYNRSRDLVRQLQDACPDLPVDVLWALLTDQSSLYRFVCFLAHAMGSGTSLPLPEEAEESSSGADRRHAAPIPLFTRLIFDGRLWEAEKQGDRVVLRPEVGTAFTLSTTHVQQLLATGAATLAGEAAPSQLSEEARTTAALVLALLL